MTLASATTKVSYSGNGSTTSFSVTFVYWDDTDIEVILRSSAGVETTWVLNTQYTLSGGGGSTGTLTVDTSPTDYTPASGETLVIRSKRADTQGTALPLGGAFPSTNVEQAIDQIVRMVQQKEELLGRTLSVPKTDTATDLELPIDSERASKFAAFDASGNIIASTGPTGDSTIPVTSYIETLLDDGTAAAALATLTAAGTSLANIFTASQYWAKGADLASASPLVLGTDGNYFDVTGTTGFTAMTAASPGLFGVQFDGALLLTHHATTLNLPGAANITTVAGDRMIFFVTAANTVHVLAFITGDGRMVTGLATGAEVITGTEAAKAITPATLEDSLLVPACLFTFTPGSSPAVTFIGGNSGAPSVAQNGTGDYTVTLAGDMASAAYVVLIMGEHSASLAYHTVSLAAGSFDVLSTTTAGSAADPSVKYSVAVYGPVA